MPPLALGSLRYDREELEELELWMSEPELVPIVSSASQLLRVLDSVGFVWETCIDRAIEDGLDLVDFFAVVQWYYANRYQLSGVDFVLNFEDAALAYDAYGIRSSDLESGEVVEEKDENDEGEEEEQYLIETGAGTLVYTACDACEGARVFDDGQPCSFCEGRGYRLTPLEEEDNDRTISVPAGDGTAPGEGVGGPSSSAGCIGYGDGEDVHGAGISETVEPVSLDRVP